MIEVTKTMNQIGVDILGDVSKVSAVVEQIEAMTTVKAKAGHMLPVCPSGHGARLQQVTITIEEMRCP
jgi:hypothetical protein